MAAKSLLLLLGAFLVLPSAAVLPSCCVDVNGNYNDTVTAITVNMTIVCSNCGSIALAVFPNLQYVAQDVYIVNVEPVGTLSVTCTNCAITSFGTFPSLLAISYADCFTDCRYAHGFLSLTCNNCPQLGTMAQFPVMTTLIAPAQSQNVQPPAGNLPLAQLTMVCTSCGALTSFASMPQLAQMTATTVVARCTDCAQLVTFANYGLLTALGPQTFPDGQLYEFTCVRCSSLQQMALFPLVTTVAFSSIVQGVFFFLGSFTCDTCAQLQTFFSFPSVQSMDVSNVTATCLGCTSLVTIANFSSAQSLWRITSDSRPVALTIICTQCNQLTALGHFPSMTTMGLSAATLALSCTQCSSLTSLGPFTMLRTVGGSMSLSCSNCAALVTGVSFPALQTILDNTYAGTAGLSISCSTCSALTVMVDLPALTALASTDVARSIYYVSNVQVQLTCVDCPSVTAMGNMPSLAALGQWPFNFGGSLFTTVSISCTNCAQLQTLALLPTLQHLMVTVSTNANGAHVTLSCANCPNVNSIGVYSNLQTLAPGIPATSFIDVTCSNCPALTNVSVNNFPSISPAGTDFAYVSLSCFGCGPTFVMGLPISYSFFGDIGSGGFGSIINGARLTLRDAAVGASNNLFENGIAPIRLSSLSLVNISIVNLDSFAGLERIDGTLTITQCPTLMNMDGVTVSLQVVSSVLVTNNPMLCNVDVNKLELIASNVPVISNNGPSTCALIVPNTPADLTPVTVSSSSVVLSWPAVSQPSIAVTYTLFINALPLLTYPSAHPPAQPYTITSLSPRTSYTFVMSATIGSVSRSSSAVTVVTLGGVATSCPPGQVGTLGDCTLCLAGTFVNDNATVCISCPTGTASNTTGLTTSSGCIPCAANTYAPTAGLSACLPCPAQHFCPYGASDAFVSQSQTVAVPASAGVVSAAAATASSASASGIDSITISVPNETSLVVAYGYIFLIVFAVACVVLTLLLAPCHKRVRRCVGVFSSILRTPRFLLRVDAGGSRIIEQRSMLRGMVGIYVLVGVILVTVYQIYYFVLHEYGLLETLQPGTTLTDNSPIVSAPTQLQAVVSFLSSPISCSAALFTIAVSMGSTQLLPTCTTSGSVTTIAFSTAPKTALTFSTPTTAVLSLTVTATESSVAFAPVMQYTLQGTRYNGELFVVNETIASSGNSAVTGPTTVVLAGVAVEERNINSIVIRKGYTFSYISTTPTVAALPSNSLSLTFEIDMPAYFQQVNQVQSISVIALLSGLLAIGGGVITAGTLLAFFLSGLQYYRRNKQTKGMDFEGSEMQAAAGTSSY